MLTLTADEQNWLEAYKKALAKRFPGLVEDIVIFGSKARGDPRPDSDLDVLVVIRAGDWRQKNEVMLAGDRLTIGTNVLASILVCNREEFLRWKQEESFLVEDLERDGISVR